jgi:hypothetical protein
MLVFRQAYDHLQAQMPQTADREYLRVLHLAASTSETEVALALTLLLEQGLVPTFDATRDLVQAPRTVQLPELTSTVLDLTTYDQLLETRCAHA